MPLISDFFNNKPGDKSRLTQYSSKELLKIFALLQLYPQNHGKNVRLEETITEVVKNINNKPAKFDYTQLRKDILAACPRNMHEDPPEEFFTENIVFSNGNNIVYPGIATNGTEIIQGLVNSIIASENLPKSFIHEVMPGILLVLHIHHHIARSLGHSHRMYEVEKSHQLLIPDEQEILSRKDHFSFTFFDIKAISDQLRIPYNTIDQFVFLWQKEKLEFKTPDENPLFRKPFVFIDNEFILVLPTAELLCLNEFILAKAKAHNCTEELIKTYAQDVIQELYPELWRTGWRPVEFNFSAIESRPKSFVMQESLWKIDSDKLAYVTVLTEDPSFTETVASNTDRFSKEFVTRIEKTSEAIKIQHKESKILLTNLIHKSKVINYFGLTLNDIKHIDYQLHLSPLIVQLLIHNWKFDKLTFWKYAKYLDAAERRIRFMPLNTHLSKFDWYMRNDESFFDSDKEPFTDAFFGFEIEGDVKRKGLRKLDKLGIPFTLNGQAGFLQCYRKESHYPVYISLEVNIGVFRSCLLKYVCPIWLSSSREHDSKADIYINGILYWLNELYGHLNGLMELLGPQPITIFVDLDEAFYNLEQLASLESDEPLFRYTIHPEAKSIVIHLPIEVVQYFSSPHNEGERLLMGIVIDAIGNLVESTKNGKSLTPEEKEKSINSCIPIGNKKMITVSTGDRDLKIADVDLAKPRKIRNADISYLLENQVDWLRYGKAIPRKIKTKAEKNKLLNDLVSVHFTKVQGLIAEYDALTLLIFLMKRHESLIQKRAFRQLNYPVRQACYGKYYDVFGEFAKSESDLKKANLSMRVLIEFVACIMPSGNKLPNDDDIDLMLAHVLELINYGSISDEIRFDIHDPEIGLLPSGRIGISKRFENTTIEDFNQSVYNEEFDSYTDSFAEFFEKQKKTEGSDEKRVDPYLDKVDTVFRTETGIKLFELFGISNFIASELFRSKRSIGLFKLSEFYKLFKDSSDFTNSEIQAYLDWLTFLKRDNVLVAPKGHDKTEVYPWRYNRSISYLLRPIIRLTVSGEECLLISSRHLLMASENILSLFFSGNLKVAQAYKGIKQLVAERSGIKGKTYRNDVYEWLTANTQLNVYAHEATIRPNGFFKSDIDKGDIDILAVDRKKKVIYSIECKNTSQSKVAYEFRREIDTYLGFEGKEGLIQKHVKRHAWLQANRQYVLDKLGLDENYKIKSLVISKHILPLKHLKKTDIPFLSFDELRSKRFSFE